MIAEDIARRLPPMATRFLLLKFLGRLLNASLIKGAVAFKFFLSKNSSFSLTVPKFNDTASVILPPLTSASSADPPPISSVTNSSSGSSKFSAATPPNVASSLPLTTFKFIPSSLRAMPMSSLAFGASRRAEVPIAKIFVHL